MAQHTELEILQKLKNIMEADSRLEAQIETWFDYIPGQIPANISYPAVGIGWLGTERRTHSIGGYVRRTVQLGIILFVKEYDDKTAQDLRLKLANEVIDFLDEVNNMQVDDYWIRAVLPAGGLAAEASHNPIASDDTGYVYSALIRFPITYKKVKG